jgi:hypothetical protein
MSENRVVRVTSQSVERAVLQGRAHDVQRSQLAAFAEENNKLLGAANAQTKIDIRRRQSQQQVCKSEEQYEERIREEQYKQKIKAKTIQQNQALATEMDREYAENERRSREMQRICEESPELRELEKALKIAYLNKERAAQFEEKLLLATREQERIQAIEEQMEYDRLSALQQEGNKKHAKKAMFEDQRMVLQKQMREKQQELYEAQQQIEVDRKMVDEIVRKINIEDENDIRTRKEMQAATAKVVREYEEQRKREVLAAKAKAKAEEDEINSYNKSIAARSEGVAAKKQAAKDEADRVLARIVEETERKRKEDEEFDSLRDMLWEEELEAKHSQESQARADKQRGMREEMMQANKSMLTIKRELRVKEAENEARMLVLMRKKFAEDDANERMKEEKKRQIKTKHINMIDIQRNERKEMYQQERDEELAQAEEAGRREEYRKSVILEARKRLLQEHAQKLNGYLPGQLFENPEEYEMFQKAAHK